VIYEWDGAKASTNLRKHKVSFAEAASVFLDPLALSFFDPDHSAEEDREITIGYLFPKTSTIRITLRTRRPNPYNQRQESY
jgi:uncharacterized DUF497 family protein